MRVAQWWHDNDRTEPNNTEKPLFFFPILHQKFHLCWSVIELGPQRCETEEMIGNK